MIRQIIIGFVTEGTTDTRFLEKIIQRSFEDVAYDCKGQVEILQVQHIRQETGLEFIDSIKKSAEKAREIGVMILCIHVDADETDDRAVYKNKLDPLFKQVPFKPKSESCDNFVTIVPVQMTEAWMLADNELFKDEIGTYKSDSELGINKRVEDYSDPKETIKNAIRIARQNETKRRRRDLKIDELYSPIGQKVDLGLLGGLESYQKFKDSIRSAYKKMNYL